MPLANVTSILDTNVSREERGEEGRGWRYTPAWEYLSPSAKFGLMLHAYGFAGSFTVLAFYAFFSVLNIRSLLAARPYMSTINMFLCLLGASRALALFVDPYALRDVMPKAMGSALFDLGTACITSALCLTHLALISVTKVKLKIKGLRSKTLLSVAIALHLSCLLAVDILGALQPRFYQVVKLLVETVFLFWGVLVCVVFLYAGQRAASVLHTMPSAILDRELDPNYKGLMQLSVLAPYNNLVGSVASALIPTLLAPKLAAARNQAGSASPSSSYKNEPLKASIMKQAKLSPNSSDGEDVKCLSDRQRGMKKLSWNTEPNSNNLTLTDNKARKGKKAGAEEELDEASPVTSLLPSSKTETRDLSLETILHHIAYMRGDRPREEGSGGRAVRRVLWIARLSALCGGSLLVIELVALYLPQGWVYDGDRRWLCYETLCRGLEILAAWGVANLTKQPVSERVNSPTRSTIFM